MPHGGKQHGSRGKSKDNTKRREQTELLTRSAEADQDRLERAISKRLKHIECLERNLAGTSNQSGNTGASSSNTVTPGASSAYESGVTRVSVESDSDHPLSSEEEGPEARQDSLVEEPVGSQPGHSANSQAETHSQGLCICSALTVH